MEISEKQPLPLDQVHLWWESIDRHFSRISHLWEILSDGEKMRARRFRLEKLKHRFTVTHGRLREILSGYLGVAPRTIKFRHGPGGKPAVASDEHMIRFNLSDSGGHVLYAIARNREVGVDVEVVEPKPNAMALVDRFFSPGEAAAFQKLDPGDMEAAFFSGWTRKEAYVKAIGKGLRFPLDCFDISFKPGDQDALLSVNGSFEEAKRWLLRDIDLGSGFRAALALERKDKNAVKTLLIRSRSSSPGNPDSLEE